MSSYRSIPLAQSKLKLTNTEVTNRVTTDSVFSITTDIESSDTVTNVDLRLYYRGKKNTSICDAQYVYVIEKIANQPNIETKIVKDGYADKYLGRNVIKAEFECTFKKDAFDILACSLRGNITGYHVFELAIGTIDVNKNFTKHDSQTFNIYVTEQASQIGGQVTNDTPRAVVTVITTPNDADVQIYSKTKEDILFAVKRGNSNAPAIFELPPDQYQILVSKYGYVDARPQDVIIFTNDAKKTITTKPLTPLANPSGIEKKNVSNVNTSKQQSIEVFGISIPSNITITNDLKIPTIYAAGGAFALSMFLLLRRQP